MRKTLLCLVVVVMLAACDSGRRYATLHHAEENTPLHLALYGMHLAATTVLLEKGADLEIPNATGETPLDLMVVEPEVMALFRKNEKLAGKYAKPLGRLCSRRLERIYGAVQRLAFETGAGNRAPWPGGDTAAALAPYLGGLSIVNACPMGGTITFAPTLTDADGFVTEPSCSLAQPGSELHQVHVIQGPRGPAKLLTERPDRPQPAEDDEAAADASQ